MMAKAVINVLHLSPNLDTPHGDHTTSEGMVFHVR